MLTPPPFVRFQRGFARETALRKVTAAAKRAREALASNSTAVDVEAAMPERDSAIRKAIAAGCSRREVANAAGIDVARVQRIATDPDAAVAEAREVIQKLGLPTVEERLIEAANEKAEIGKDAFDLLRNGFTPAETAKLLGLSRSQMQQLMEDLEAVSQDVMTQH